MRCLTRLEKRWSILDWKTNQIERDAIGKLREFYLPQIAAYWKAVTEMTNQNVGAEIYSTATGKFIAYDRDQLAREWERMCDLPQDGLVAANQLSRSPRMNCSTQRNASSSVICTGGCLEK